MTLRRGAAMMRQLMAEVKKMRRVGERSEEQKSELMSPFFTRKNVDENPRSGELSTSAEWYRKNS